MTEVIPVNYSALSHNSWVVRSKARRFAGIPSNTGNNSRALHAIAFLFCAAAFPSVTAAANVTYNFSYSGTNTSIPNATGIGTGSFTVAYSNVGPQPPTALTGFSFLLTLMTNESPSESSTFAYGLADIAAYPGVILGGTTANPIPSQIAVVTTAIYGTNNIFGSVAADLNMLPSGGSVLTQSFNQLGDTSGPAVWTSIVSAPEPSLFGLLAIGALLTMTLHFCRQHESSLRKVYVLRRLCVRPVHLRVMSSAIVSAIASANMAGQSCHGV